MLSFESQPRLVMPIGAPTSSSMPMEPSLLDARVSRPFMRKGFTHSDLAAWVSEHRTELVGALLTLARAWYAAGKPQGASLPALATFTGWVKIIGGILTHAGVQGFLSNLEQLYEEADEESAQWEAFFHAWYETVEDAWVPLARIAQAILTSSNTVETTEVAGGCGENEGNALTETLPEILQTALKEKPRSFIVRLGKALEKRVDACFGVENFRLEKKREKEAETEDIRRCFIAPAGYQLLKSDLSNIELRILAEMAGDATMLRFFAEGKDLHAETAKLMFRLPPDTDTKKHLHQGVAVREIAKTINYGLSYGMGASSLAQRINVPVEEARELMHAYFATYIGVDHWLKQVAQRVRKQGYVASLAGRKRAFTFEGAGQSERASMERMARNHPIQATNADILKCALSMLVDLLPEGAHLVLAVHDEIVLECPKTLIEDVTVLLKAILVEVCRTYLKVVHIPEPEVLIASYWQKG